MSDRASFLLNDRISLDPRPSRYTLDEHLIISDDLSSQIAECIGLVRFHAQIYTAWDFRSVDPQGSTAVINFFGPPGTGKTLAAEALAGTLGMSFLPLSVVDLESSLKGQMAKNIREAFRAAREDGSLLFFDEADALLGRRIAVSQGVDSDINATRNAIMIELNAFEGIVIFATNFAKDYDKAIESRITHQLHFKLPDDDLRRRLWARHLVPRIPVAGDREAVIEAAVRASEGMTGRDILNCVRRALPKVLIEAERSGAPAQLTYDHLEAVLRQMRVTATATDRQEKLPSARQHDLESTSRILGLE
jgi:AAA+ superfamily predicted ATPase